MRRGGLLGPCVGQGGPAQGRRACGEAREVPMFYGGCEEHCRLGAPPYPARWASGAGEAADYERAAQGRLAAPPEAPVFGGWRRPDRGLDGALGPTGWAGGAALQWPEGCPAYVFPLRATTPPLTSGHSVDRAWEIIMENAPRRRGGDAAGAERTTLLLNRLPVEYSRDMVQAMLEGEGFQQQFDFLHAPCDFATGKSFGYAFVNMVSPDKALEARRHFEGFTGWAVDSDRVCSVHWAELDGLEANIEHFQNSPLMHPSVPDAYKPVLVGRDGTHTPFPPPSRPLKPPKKKKLAAV